MSGRKRVLMLASVASMIGQFNMHNLRLLLEIGYEVHVACNFREGNTCNARSIQRLRKTLCGMRVVQHQWDCPRSICAPAQCFKAYRQLRHLVLKYRFAWIHCHSPVGGALARLVGYPGGGRVIYTAHGFHFYRGAPFYYWLLYYPVEKALSCWTDILITVNREDYQIAKRRLCAGKVYRIPGVGIDAYAANGSNADGRQSFRAAYDIPADAFVLLSVGELSRRKNHQAVIRAVAALVNISGREVYYVVCGQGAWKDRLYRMAQSYGIANRIRLVGFLEDVEQAYQSADLFVFPSLQEGLPAALMEAMAAGLPCVVSDIRGNRELIDAKGGRRFPAAGKRSKRRLVKALEELLEDKALRQSCGSYNKKKAKAYDIQVVDRRMRDIYYKAFERDTDKP